MSGLTMVSLTSVSFIVLKLRACAICRPREALSKNFCTYECRASARLHVELTEILNFMAASLLKTSLQIWRFVEKWSAPLERRVGTAKSALRPKSQGLPAGECRHNGYLFRGAYSRSRLSRRTVSS